MEEVLRRIRQYPAVESAATWLGTDTYTRGRVYQGYTTDSVHVVETTVALCVSRIFRRHAHSTVAGECLGLEIPLPVLCLPW